MAPPSEAVYHSAVYRQRYGQTRVSDIRGSPQSIACCGCVLFIFSIILFFIGLILTILGYINEPTDTTWKMFRIMGPLSLGLFVMMFPLSLVTFKAAKIQEARWKRAQEEGKPPEAAHVTVDEHGTQVIRGTPGGIRNCARAMIVFGVVFVLIGIPLTVVGAVMYNGQTIPWIFLLVWGPILMLASIGMFLGGRAVYKVSKTQEERLKHPEQYTTELSPRRTNQVSTVSGSLQDPGPQDCRGAATSVYHDTEKTQYGGYTYQ
ncbi:uncharacterized protein LOC144361171 [Saccoglossus kowalevskii]